MVSWPTEHDDNAVPGPSALIETPSSEGRANALTLAIRHNGQRRERQRRMPLANGDRAERDMADDAAADVGDQGEIECVSPPQSVHQVGFARTLEGSVDNGPNARNVLGGLWANCECRIHRRERSISGTDGAGLALPNHGTLRRPICCRQQVRLGWVHRGSSPSTIGPLGTKAIAWRKPSRDPPFARSAMMS